MEFAKGGKVEFHTVEDLTEVDNAYVIPYTQEQREQMHAEVMENLSRLDGTKRSRVKLLSGMTDEEIDELGGL